MSLLKMLKNLVVVSFALAVSGLPTNSTTFQIGAPVNTTSGVIVGHPAPNSPEVSEYLAIPYAQPALGDLRFEKPVAFNGTATINSSVFALNCPHPPVVLPGLAGMTETEQFVEYLDAIGTGKGTTSEDCMYLNVWSKPQTGSNKKPVMVFFHPGGFRSGGANNAGFSGQYYADLYDMVIVTFSYRVSSLGFPGMAGHALNLGLRDQRVVMEWVRDNIDGFGGDVDRIIAWGESAGAAGIDFYNYAYTEDPIIAGAIMESGSTVLGQALSNATATGLWYKFVNAANCYVAGGTSYLGDQQAQLECLKQVDISTLISAQLAVSKGTYAFGPVVDNELVYDDYTGPQSQGAFVKVPLLTGNNDYEAAWFKLTQGDTQDEDYYTAVNLDYFTCVAENLCSIRSQFNIPSWRYRIYPTFPDTVHPYNSSIAMHTGELPFVFGTGNDSITSVSTTPDEDTLSKTLMTYWAAFAHDPKAGLTNAGWPVYDTSTDSLALFGYDGVYGNATFVSPSLTDSECGSTVGVYCAA